MTSSSGRPIPTIDRISDLPDSILSHILSFLPTKEAATTSILSKRWKLVWLSILTLNFDQTVNLNFWPHFQDFVYFTISSLRENTIQSFNFKCSRGSSFNQRGYNHMLKLVMQRRVESLEFDMSERSRIIKLPSNILNMKTLRVLKLANIKIGDFDQVDFPLVKTLHLDRISFISTKYIEKFLLGFPILENLYSQSYVSKKSPLPREDVNALPNLLKVRICDLNTPMALVCKAKFLDMIKISWTTLPMFYNLTYMKLSVHDDFCGNKCTWLLGILPYFPKLQHFIIQDYADKTTNCRNFWKHPPAVPECLSSQLKTCCIKCLRGIGSKYVVEFVKYIMQHSEVLETMTIRSSSFEKDQMLRELSSFKRSSKKCKLLFN